MKHTKPMPRVWRIKKAHDLWGEIREGYGHGNRLVAACQELSDAKHIVAMHNALVREKRHNATLNHSGDKP